MPETYTCPELRDPWSPTDEVPLLGLASALALAFGAFAILFSLAT